MERNKNLKHFNAKISQVMCGVGTLQASHDAANRYIEILFGETKAGHHNQLREQIQDIGKAAMYNA